MMERNKEQEQKCQGGAATVEAIVSFSCFLFVVFTILTTVKYCRAQALISNAVDSAAKELSQYSYFYEMSGLGKVSKALGDNASVGADNINSGASLVHALLHCVEENEAAVVVAEFCEASGAGSAQAEKSASNRIVKTKGRVRVFFLN